MCSTAWSHSRHSVNGCCYHCATVLSGERIPFLAVGSGPSRAQGSRSKGRGVCQLIPPLPGRPRLPERSGGICKDKHRPLVALATGHAPQPGPGPAPLCPAALNLSASQPRASLAFWSHSCDTESRGQRFSWLSVQTIPQGPHCSAQAQKL